MLFMPRRRLDPRRSPARSYPLYPRGLGAQSSRTRRSPSRMPRTAT